MTTEEREFRDWLKKNKEILADRMTDEIAYLAIHQCGFDADIVYKVLSHYPNDRLMHNTYEIREKWFVDRELNSVNMLKESWDHLGRYLTQGRGFND
jgi:hypothetical protein